jgi:hypothetical protein
MRQPKTKKKNPKRPTAVRWSDMVRRMRALELKVEKLEYRPTGAYTTNI